MAERPQFSNYEHDIPPALARLAIFIVPFAHEMIDGREASEKIVAGCEESSCALPMREGDNDETS
jgi:hypothetical protein